VKSNEDKSTIIKSEVFIGARDLGQEVYKILPTFDLVIKQIEQIRAGIKNTNRDKSQSVPAFYYKKDVNNTIGIFGARGTGKTSVLYTLINKLNHQVSKTFPFLIHHNIMLQIIEPDHFGDNTSIMGSIVGLLKKAVEQQLEQIQKVSLQTWGEMESFKDYLSKGIYKSNNPLQNSLNEVIEYHMYTASEYRKLLIHTYDDLATHIKKSARLLTPDIEFKEKLHKLISCLVANQCALLQLQTDEVTLEPLVFLFVDDIDLKMTRSRELVEAILQYANHPNIVTVLSGDYDILHESIMLALIQDEQLHKSNLSVHFKVNAKESIKDRKQYLAHEYIKKIIPPARRHQLLQWNENTIPNFSFDNQTLMHQLNKLLGNKSFQFSKCTYLY
jgi:GTPase SAR1 family protein